MKIEPNAEPARETFPGIWRDQALLAASEDACAEATDWLTSNRTVDTALCRAVRLPAGLCAGAWAHCTSRPLWRQKAARVKTWARFYTCRLLPEHIGLLAHAQARRPIFSRFPR